MKKQNTWMTIALGGLVTVTVAAVAIVWSGTRTEENPDIALESTNRPDTGNKYTEELFNEEGAAAAEPTEKENEEDQVVYGTWEVNEEILSSFLERESEAAAENASPLPEQVIEVVPETEDAEAAEAAGNQVYSLNFASGETVGWPVRGNVIQYYSMDTTVYFPTLEQYKCSPAIEIQSEAGTVVSAPANARIAEVGTDAKIGGFVRLELGNDYQIILGQLTDICVSEGDYIARGAQIGTVASPTRYYVVEGDNLYFQMLHGEETVDPLDYLE